MSKKWMVVMLVAGALLLSGAVMAKEAKEGARAPKVTPSVLKMVYPVGGERIAENSEVNIQWTLKDISPLRVEILLSTDGGQKYSKLASALPTEAMDHWTWKAASPAGETMRVRVIVYSTEQDFMTESESNFAIGGQSSKLDPRTGMPKIDAAKPGNEEATMNAAKPGDEAAGSPSDPKGEAPKGPSRPEGIESHAAHGDPSQGDAVGDGKKGGTPQALLTVLAPNGAEKVAKGSVFKITWQADPTVGNFSVLLNCAPEKNWAVLAEKLPAGTTSFDWTVSQELCRECLIKVTGANLTMQVIEDESDKAFQIVKASTAPKTTPSGQ